MQKSLLILTALLVCGCSSSFVYRNAPIDSAHQDTPNFLASRLQSSVKVGRIDGQSIEFLITIRNSSGQRIAIIPEAIEIYSASRSSRHRDSVISPLRYLEEMKERNARRIAALQSQFHHAHSSASDSAQDLETTQQLAAIRLNEHAVHRKVLWEQALSDGQEVQGLVYAAVTPRSVGDTLIVRIPTPVDTPSFRFVKTSLRKAHSTGTAYEREADHAPFTPQRRPGT
jgi:hypothetical protein